MLFKSVKYQLEQYYMFWNLNINRYRIVFCSNHKIVFDWRRELNVIAKTLFLKKNTMFVNNNI